MPFFLSSMHYNFQVKTIWGTLVHLMGSELGKEKVTIYVKPIFIINGIIIIWGQALNNYNNNHYYFLLSMITILPYGNLWQPIGHFYTNFGTVIKDNLNYLQSNFGVCPSSALICTHFWGNNSTISTVLDFPSFLRVSSAYFVQFPCNLYHCTNHVKNYFSYFWHMVQFVLDTH